MCSPIKLTLPGAHTATVGCSSCPNSWLYRRRASDTSSETVGNLLAMALAVSGSRTRELEMRPNAPTPSRCSRDGPPDSCAESRAHNFLDCCELQQLVPTTRRKFNTWDLTKRENDFSVSLLVRYFAMEGVCSFQSWRLIITVFSLKGKVRVDEHHSCKKFKATKATANRMRL